MHGAQQAPGSISIRARAITAPVTENGFPDSFSYKQLSGLCIDLSSWGLCSSHGDRRFCSSILISGQMGVPLRIPEREFKMSKGISLFPEPTCTSLVISRPFRGAQGQDCYCKHPCSSVKARAKLPFGLRLSFSSQLGQSKEAVRLTGDFQ